MRKTLLHSAVLAILIGILGGQITELFDHWDPPLQTGSDVDYAVVIVAACLGVVFAVSKKLVSAGIRVFSPAKLLQISMSTSAGFRATPEPLDTGPPLLSRLSLRI